MAAFADYLVKGTHVYSQANSNIPIVVYVNGPDGTSASGQTALAAVTNMPSGIPGTAPARRRRPPLPPSSFNFPEVTRSMR